MNDPKRTHKCVICDAIFCGDCYANLPQTLIKFDIAKVRYHNEACALCRKIPEKRELLERIFREIEAETAALVPKPRDSKKIPLPDKGVVCASTQFEGMSEEEMRAWEEDTTARIIEISEQLHNLDDSEIGRRLSEEEQREIRKASRQSRKAWKAHSKAAEKCLLKKIADLRGTVVASTTESTDQESSFDEEEPLDHEAKMGSPATIKCLGINGRLTEVLLTPGMSQKSQRCVLNNELCNCNGENDCVGCECAGGRGAAFNINTVRKCASCDDVICSDCHGNVPSTKITFDTSAAEFDISHACGKCRARDGEINFKLRKIAKEVTANLALRGMSHGAIQEAREASRRNKELERKKERMEAGFPELIKPECPDFTRMTIIEAREWKNATIAENMELERIRSQFSKTKLGADIVAAKRVAREAEIDEWCTKLRDFERSLQSQIVAGLQRKQSLL